MRAAGAVPRQAGLRVDGTIGLRADEVKPSNVGVGHGDPGRKVGGAHPVRVDVDEQLAAALAALSQRAHLHNLPGRPDRYVAVRAVVGVGNDLAREEWAHLPDAANRRAGREQRPTRVKDHPHLAMGGGDGRLVDKAEQPTVVTTRLGRGAAGRRDDVTDEVEGQAAIRAQRDGHRVLDLEQVGHEQIAISVEGQARVAAGVAEVVVIADQLRGPGLAAVEADALEHARRQSGFPVADVGHEDDVLGVRGVDCDCLLGLVEVPLADVDVGRRRADCGTGCGDRQCG